VGMRQGWIRYGHEARGTMRYGHEAGGGRCGHEARRHGVVMRQGWRRCSGLVGRHVPWKLPNIIWSCYRLEISLRRIAARHKHCKREVIGGEREQGNT
jgi:hypothetical protein